VRMYGAAAVIRYRSRLDIAGDDQESVPRLHWHTDIYERRDDRWQIVWSQATEVLDS
jgi:hypothetical protein